MKFFLWIIICFTHGFIHLHFYLTLQLFPFFIHLCHLIRHIFHCFRHVLPFLIHFLQFLLHFIRSFHMKFFLWIIICFTHGFIHLLFYLTLQLTPFFIHLCHLITHIFHCFRHVLPFLIHFLQFLLHFIRSFHMKFFLWIIICFTH